MNKHNLRAGCILFAGMLLLSACGQRADTAESGSPDGTAAVQPNPAPSTGQSADDSETAADAQILVVLDQTQLPIESGGLTFSFKRIPEGYSLSEMQWNSQKEQNVTTYEQARENGASGGDGFYISGDGQFSGFLYPNERKGEEGEISFVFVNDDDQRLTWAKTITLQ